jgi:hypothetical protein
MERLTLHWLTQINRNIAVYLAHWPSDCKQQIKADCRVFIDLHTNTRLDPGFPSAIFPVNCRRGLPFVYCPELLAPGQFLIDLGCAVLDVVLDP